MAGLPTGGVRDRRANIISVPRGWVEKLILGAEANGWAFLAWGSTENCTDVQLAQSHHT